MRIAYSYASGVVAMVTALVVRAIVEKSFPGLLQTIYGDQMAFCSKNRPHLAFCVKRVFKVKQLK